jgi:hypothetical protein
VKSFKELNQLQKVGVVVLMLVLGILGAWLTH